MATKGGYESAADRIAGRGEWRKKQLQGRALSVYRKWAVLRKYSHGHNAPCSRESDTGWAPKIHLA